MKLLLDLVDSLKTKNVLYLFFVLFEGRRILQIMNKLTFSILLSLLAFTANSQNRFIENGGQWDDNVSFRTDIPGGKLYLEQDRLTFDLYDVATTNAVFAAHSGSDSPMTKPEYLNGHAYQLIFEGADFAENTGCKAYATRYSFYTGKDRSQWAGDLKGFAEVLYPKIYPGIDLKVYSNSALKYDFILAAGADPSLITLRYEGVKPRLNKKGQLELKTSVGEVLESEPFAYQMIDGLITRVECAYRVSGDRVSFKLGAYDEAKELIIDPELIFSTYSGSFSDNFGYTATFDLAGHLYSGSTAFGTSYPTTTGAYQTAWGGGDGGALAGTDIAISKFALDGSELLYSTYLGGSVDELPHSIIVNEQNELFVFGTTGSADYPVTELAFQTEFAGGDSINVGGIGVDYGSGCDIIVSRLSADGTELLASTFIGGSLNDGINSGSALRFNYADEVRGEIELDALGNIIVGSCTFSADFPTTTGAFQTTKGAGQDGVLFRMTANLENLIASTFLGGNNADAIYSIHSTGTGRITAGGGTISTDLPTTTGCFQPAYGGGPADGFVFVFPSNLNSLNVGTYYGSDAYDQIYFVERDGDGLPHIFGQTRATENTFIENAAFSNPNSGNLLSKFSENLDSRIWSTVFGNGTNNPNISPTAFSVDICNRVYLSGWGGNVGSGLQGTTVGLPTTIDALKSNTDGGDFYFLVMESDASVLTFASFFGGNTSGEHVDGGTSRFDRTGKIYQAVCAGCGNNDDFPFFPDTALSATNNSPNCNLGVAKIDFDLPLVFAGFEVEPVCLPNPVVFENTSSSFGGNNSTYEWTFPGGETTTIENPEFFFDAPGVYEVRLIIDDFLACNLADTVIKTVEVFPELIVEIPDTLQSCTASEFMITVTTSGSGSYFEWSTDAGFNTIIQEGETDSILVFQTETQTKLYFRASNGLCTQTEEVLLSPAPSLSLSTGDTLLCAAQEFPVSIQLFGGSEIARIIWAPIRLS